MGRTINGERHADIVVKRRRSTGVLAGMLGCVFGAFGIVTLGIVFVPLAALCSVIGLLRGLAGLSGAGIAVSLLGGVLTILGFVFSPGLWLLAGGLLVASQAQEPTAPSTRMVAMTDKPDRAIRGDLLRESAVQTAQEERITLKKGETLGAILRNLGATPDEIKAILAALGPRGRDGALKEGQKIKVLLSPVRGSQRLRPVRVTLVGDTTIEAVVALSDLGKYVAVDVEQTQVADADEDDGAGMRLYQKMEVVPPPTIPEAEKLLIAAVEWARAAYAAGANEMAQGAARPARANEICAAFKDFRVGKGRCLTGDPICRFACTWT
jgi:hypothetical protein